MASLDQAISNSPFSDLHRRSSGVYDEDEGESPMRKYASDSDVCGDDIRSNISANYINKYDI